MKFWLGVHRPHFLGLTAAPACVSYGTLRGRKHLPQPLGPVFLDSRGFSEIFQHGRYTFSPKTYARFVRRAKDEWGDRLAHASIMDWMCEVPMLTKTGMTVGQHQQLTVNSWLALNGLDSDLPWVPVIQGYTVADYHRCVDLYERQTTVRLQSLPLVGLGSVCQRQGMKEAATIVKSLYARGFRNLHGFGFKVTGLTSRGLRLAKYLASSDSMAWSRYARQVWQKRQILLCGGSHYGGKTGCRNCLPWALKWGSNLRRRVEESCVGGTQQLLY